MALGNKEIMAKNISKYMEKAGVDRNKLSTDLGISYTTITDWIKGKTYPRIDKIELLANYFGISKSDLVEDSVSDITTIYNQLVPPRQEKVYNFAERQLEEQNRKVVPLFGTTAANPTELSYGDINMEDTIEINVPKKAECALVVKGDSMEPEYQNGDIVFYKSQPAVENGEMAIVEIDGDGVTLKKIYYNYDDDKVVLRSLNGKYEDRELEPERVRILGKVVK